MKLTRLVVVTVAALLFVSCALAQNNARRQKKSCWDTAMDQPAMNECAFSEYKSAESDLDRTYSQLLKKASGDPIAVDKIKAAQKAWLAFRDAQLAAIYPHDAPDKRTVYGSGYPACETQFRTELTKARTRMLQKMLKPDDHDVCNSGFRYAPNYDQTGGPHER